MFEVGDIVEHIYSGYGFILNERKYDEVQWYLVKWFINGQEVWLTPNVIKYSRG
jgi:hypothetical protein